MQNDVIEKFIATKAQDQATVTIYFKKRSTLKGIFIQSNDYEELKSKNFWRIVSESNAAEWLKSKDMNLARLFNGAEFVKLASKN